jgi:hypothetical protein
MSVLQRYVLRQAVAPLVLFVLLGWILVWLSQGLRLGHLLAGALSEPQQVAAIAFASLPTVATATLPFALAAALVVCFARLRVTGELIGMQTIGIRPTQAFRPLALVMLLLGAAACTLAATVEHRSLTRLQALIAAAAARSAVTRLEPGKFNRLGAGFALYLESRQPLPDGSHQLNRVVLTANEPLQLLLADSARFTHRDSASYLELREGEAHLVGSSGQGAHLQFGSFELSLPLESALRRHVEFVGRLTGRWRNAGLAASCASFILLTLWGLLQIRWPTALAVVLGALIAHESLIWTLALHLPTGVARVTVGAGAVGVLLVGMFLHQHDSGRAKTRSNARRTAFE